MDRCLVGVLAGSAAVVGLSMLVSWWDGGLLVWLVLMAGAVPLGGLLAGCYWWVRWRRVPRCPRCGRRH